MNRTFAAVAAIAVAVLMLALLVPASGIARPSSAPAATGSGPALDLNAPLSGELKASVLQQASAAAAKAGLTSTQSQAELTRVAAMSPEQLLSSAGLSPAAIHAAANCGPLPGSCSSNAGATLGGCAIGGILGASAGPIGAGIGCAVGAAAALVMFEYGLSQAGNQIRTQYTQWATAMAESAWNEGNLTNTGTENLLSALNFSAIAFQRMADNAAVFQLGNSSYNIPQDEYQSGLAAQMATLYASYVAQLVSIPRNVATWFTAQTGAGAEFNTVGTAAPYFATSGIGAPVEGGIVDASSFVPWPGVALQAPGVGFHLVYVPLGVSYVYLEEGSSALSITVTNYLVHSETQTYSLPADTAAQFYNATWTLPGGVYWFNNTVATNVFVPGGSAVPSAPDVSLAGGAIGETPTYGFSTDNEGMVGGGGPTGQSNPIVIMPGESLTIGTWTSPTYTAVTPVAGIATGYISQYYAQVLAGLEFNASVNGEVYWSFLHSIGFHSITQIPPDCLVPAPYQVLPSDLNLGNLTATQLQSLYMAWLQGLGNFYNVSLSGTAFCGAQAPKQFHLGNTTWGNLQVNATGDVYLNNGTSPIGLNGKALASELYGNASTWALTKDQLLLMPTVGTVHIPVGVKWAVPANNPIEIYAVQPGQMFRATGNGTSSPATLVPLATAAPGDSLYLTSCVVGGVVQTNCTVTVQTINTTVANLSCGLGSTGPGSCQTVSSGGTFGGFPNPFTWLSGLFSGLFGGGPLGSLLGGLVAGLVILAVIAVLVYVAVIEVEAWGGKKRGGGSGGGSTVVVQGGR